MRRRGLAVPAEALERSYSPPTGEADSPTTKELAARLDRIENQLSFFVSSISRGLSNINSSAFNRATSPQDQRINHGPRSLCSSSVKSPPKSSVSLERDVRRG